MVRASLALRGSCNLNLNSIPMKTLLIVSKRRLDDLRVHAENVE